MSADATKKRSWTKRRAVIFSGLHSCVIERGISATTLADIAKAAGMTPSHLLYYFSDKGDILAQYFGEVSEKIIERLAEYRPSPPLQKIDQLAKLFFRSRGLSKSEIGLMLECFGAAVHESKLRQHKSSLDRYCKGFLNELFSEFGGDKSRSADAAEAAYALLVGLRTAVYFDQKLTVKDAHRVFRNEMLRLAGAKPGDS